MPSLNNLALLSRADELRRGGDLDEAVRLLEPVALSDAPDASALRLLGLCRLRQGDLAQALALLEQARALAPQDARVRLNLGLINHSLGRHQAAAELFAACCKALPDDPAPPLNLAAALLALGRPRDALQSASDACFRAPALAEAHYTYGLAWLAVEEPGRAEAAFSETVRLKPAFPDAWVNLGVARYRKGDAEGAKRAMRNALQIAPGHRAATANLGAFMRLTGESEESEQVLRDLLTRDPDAVEVRLNLAADLLSEERAAEALDLLAIAPPRHDGQRQHWRLQQALALLQSRRPADARAVLGSIGPVAPALAPLLHWRGVLLAEAEGDPPRAQDQALRMEAALDAAGAAMVPEHKIMARYDLAKFWSKRNLPDHAFPQWVRGHGELKRFQPFSRADYQAFVDASLTAFDRARLQDGPRAANCDPAPVFIVGMPRSGTTLAEQILAAHPQVHGAGERNALGQAFAALGGAWESAAAATAAAAQPAAALDQVGAAYLRELKALAGQDAEVSRIVDKMPGNFRYLGLAAVLLPGARIIHCVRDPRDIGLSIFTFRFHGHHGYAHDLADLGWYIGQHDRLMAHWRAALPNPILTLRLSDWVSDFDGALRRVLDFLDLPYDSACERFYEGEGRVRTVSRTQVRQPVNDRGLGRWRLYERHLQPLIEELAAGGSLAGWD